MVDFYTFSFLFIHLAEPRGLREIPEPGLNLALAVNRTPGSSPALLPDELTKLHTLTTAPFRITHSGLSAQIASSDREQPLGSTEVTPAQPVWLALPTCPHENQDTASSSGVPPPPSRPWVCVCVALPGVTCNRSLGSECSKLPLNGVCLRIQRPHHTYMHNNAMDGNMPLPSAFSGRPVLCFLPTLHRPGVCTVTPGEQGLFQSLICLLSCTSKGCPSGHPLSQCSAALWFFLDPPSSEHPLLVGTTTGLSGCCCSSSLVGPSPSIHPKRGAFPGVHPRLPLSHWTHASHRV